MGKTTLMLFFGGFLVTTFVKGDAPHPFGPSVTAFSLDVLKSLSKAELESANKNLLFSSSSLYKTLLDLYLGSSGVSKQNLAKTLHLEDVNFDVSKNFKDLRNLNPNIVREGERLFYDNKYNIKKEFKELINEDVEGISPKARESKEIINDWATETMGYKVKIVKKKQLQSMTFLPISLAFSKYNLKNTLEYIIPTHMEFSPSEDKVERVASMDRLDDFKYHEYESLKTKTLSIQYKRSQLSFIILLPDEGQTVRQLIDSLTVDTITDILQNLKDKKIVLQMPQIRTEEVLNITRMCRALKICDLFKKGNNDLQGITTDFGFYISDFTHKVGFQLFAEVEVPVPQPWYSGVDFFTVDRPFVYMVYDNEANMPMILGAMMNPKPL